MQKITLAKSFKTKGLSKVVVCSLTTSQDLFTALTDGDDTVNGTQATIGSTDVITDDSATDNDTVMIASDGTAIDLGSIVGIENITVNVTDFGTAGTITATNVASGTLTVNNLQLLGSDDADVADAGDITVVAGAGVTDLLSVAMVEDAATVVDAGEAATVEVTAVGSDQVVSVTVNGDVAVDALIATDLNITATAAAVVSFDVGNSTAIDTITGDANTTLLGVTSLVDFDGLTITGAAVVSGGGATVDVTGVTSAILVDDAGNAILTVADDVVVEFDTVGGVNQLTADDDGDTAVDFEQTATITLSDDTTTAGDYDITLNAGADGDEITTLGIVATGDLAGATGAVALDVSGNALDTTINVSGAGDIDMAVTTTGGGDVTLNAAALTGSLIVTATAEMLSITGGLGDDTITALTTAAFDLVGGAGDDTLVADTDMTAGTFSGFEILDIADDDAFLASQLSGYTAIVATITGSINVSTASAAIDISTINMSGLTAQTATDDIDIDLGDIDTSAVLTGQAITYTGWNGVDTVQAGANGDTISTGAGADIITGGAGDDTITGGAGTDSIEGAAGADTIILTETTDVVDTVIYSQGDGSAVDTGTGTFTEFDVVTGFTTTSDTIDVSAVLVDEGDIQIFDQADASTTALDLSDAEFTDQAAVIAFINDQFVAVDLNTTDDVSAVAITFSDFTAIYAFDDDDNDDVVDTGELELLTTVDAILVTVDII